eukprot:scaffold168890_cov25-Prasinocladus_malaysianus.AAC.1
MHGQQGRLRGAEQHHPDGLPAGVLDRVRGRRRGPGRVLRAGHKQRDFDTVGVEVVQCSRAGDDGQAVPGRRGVLAGQRKQTYFTAAAKTLLHPSRLGPYFLSSDHAYNK